jgi:hypothetical protein
VSKHHVVGHERMEVNSHTFLPSALGGGEWSAYATVSLSQKDPDTPWKGGKMGAPYAVAENRTRTRDQTSVIPGRGRCFSSVHMLPSQWLSCFINYCRV